MSPLNRGPLLGPRVPPVGLRPPLPRFGGRLPPPGLPPRMPPPPMSPVFGPMRQRMPLPPRPGGVVRPNGPLPLFGPRVRGMAPMVPPMGLRATGPRGPPMRPWPRRALPPQIMSHMRPRFPVRNGNSKGKVLNNAKKGNKLEELELKKPWMTDEIRSEIQKKNKLYAKAKKNKDAKEWEEFKDLRNKVTRMIRDAKNDYLAKHPEQAHLYPSDEAPYDQRDENYASSEDEESYYCEVCDRDFPSETALFDHKNEHKLCGIDGCTFSAHPLLVERHISMQHSTGLYQRLKNLSTPEDIQKWLMERKKRYPTKVNIDLQKAEEMEKTKRGEIIKQKQDVLKRRKKRSSNVRDRKRTVQRRPDRRLNNMPQQTVEVYRGVPAFTGTLRLREVDSEKVNSSENSIEETNEKTVNYISDEEDIPAAPLKFLNATSCLPTLVANYGSDSEESDGPEDVPIKKEKMTHSQVSNIVEKTKAFLSAVEEKTTNNALLDKEGLKELPQQQSMSHSVSEHTDTKGQEKQEIARNQYLKGKDSRRTLNRKRPKRLQLLERLLSRSIQYERNLICQCIKYVVDNNFFN